MLTLAGRVHRPQMSVERGLVSVWPTPLPWRTATLKHVLQLLLTRPSAENWLAEGELGRKAPVPRFDTTLGQGDHGPHGHEGDDRTVRGNNGP